MHPLKIAYYKYIRDTYGYPIRASKKPDNEDRIVQTAQKILNIGVDYYTYVELACTICNSLAKFKGWKYPYWNVVLSDNIIDKVSRLVVLENTDIGDDSADMFDMELEYAIGIIAWVRGESEKPQHIVDVPADIKIKVAEYICMLAGKECTTSNYIVLARILDD